MNSYTEDEYMKMILIIGTYISNMKDTLDGSELKTMTDMLLKLKDDYKEVIKK